MGWSLERKAGRMRIGMKEAETVSLREAVEEVLNTGEALTVNGPHGRSVKLAPVPEPTGVFHGRKVYHIDDLQYLIADI